MVITFRENTSPRWAREAGALCGRRKVDIAELFCVVVLGLGTGRERTLSGLRRDFARTTGLTLEESSVYVRFNKGFRDLMRRVTGEVFSSLEGIRRALEGSLTQFRDLVLTDSPVLRLHYLLEKPFPAYRTNHT